MTANGPAIKFVCVGRRSTGKSPGTLDVICHGATEAMARVFAVQMQRLRVKDVSR